MKRMMQVLTVVVLVSASLVAHAAEKLFDAGRNPEQGLHAAMQQARAEHKNILMDVGGNWCPWCILVDRTLNGDAQLHDLLTRNYVVLLVNYSQENENKAFLSHYPAPKGFPAWYVLSPEGKLLKAEDTSLLEQTHKLDAGYSKPALKDFLVEYAPKPR